MRESSQAAAAELHALARKLATVVREAGVLAREAFGKPMKTWVKQHNSPVSEVDIAVNVLLQQRLTAIAPEAGWLSEESEDDPARLGPYLVETTVRPF